VLLTCHTFPIDTWRIPVRRVDDTAGDGDAATGEPILLSIFNVQDAESHKFTAEADVIDVDARTVTTRHGLGGAGKQLARIRTHSNLKRDRPRVRLTSPLVSSHTTACLLAFTSTHRNRFGLSMLLCRSSPEDEGVACNGLSLNASSKQYAKQHLRKSGATLKDCCSSELTDVSGRWTGHYRILHNKLLSRALKVEMFTPPSRKTSRVSRVSKGATENQKRTRRSASSICTVM
jgi:hypothetical protein